MKSVAEILYFSYCRARIMFDLSKQRLEYHKRFSCSIEDKVINFVVQKLLASGDRYFGFPKKSHIKDILVKVDLAGIKDQLELDEKKISMKYVSYEDEINSTFLDNDIYTIYLVQNLRQQLNCLPELNNEEAKVKDLLVISPQEKRILDQVLIAEPNAAKTLRRM